MVVNVLTSSQKYLFFVETNTAGYCHFRTSPAVFVKTKKRIFLTKTRDIYSHFGGGEYLPDITSWILSRGLFKYVSCRRKHGWRCPDFSESHGWSCQEVSSKASSFVVTSTTSYQIYQFFLSPSTQAPSQTAAAGLSSLLFHHFFPSLLRNVCIAE